MEFMTRLIDPKDYNSTKEILEGIEDILEHINQGNGERNIDTAFRLHNSGIPNFMQKIQEEILSREVDYGDLEHTTQIANMLLLFILEAVTESYK